MRAFRKDIMATCKWVASWSSSKLWARSTTNVYMYYWIHHYRIISIIYLTSKRVLSHANCWNCIIAFNTFLCPPGTRQRAPSISKANRRLIKQRRWGLEDYYDIIYLLRTFVLRFVVFKLWAITVIPVGCAKTWALPS